MSKGWAKKKLGDVCSISSKLIDPREPDYLDLPHVGAGNMISGSGELIDIKTAKEESLKSGKFLFDEAMVLYSKIRPYLMKVARPEFHGLCSADVYPLSPDQTQMDRDFLFHLLLSKSFTEYAIQGSARSGMPKVNRKHLFEFTTHFPAVSEQKRIVAILDEVFAGIDDAIANTQENLANTRNLFESYLSTVFAQKEGVPLVTIGDIGKVFDGPHATPKTVDSGPVFLGISALQDGVLRIGKTRHVSPEDFKKWTRRVEPQADDIVFSYETRLGQAAIIPEGLKCCLGRRMGLIRVDKTQIEPSYLLSLYIAPPFQKFLKGKTVRGATVNRISIKEFPSFQIPLPSLDIQRSISSEVRVMSTKTQRLEAIYQQKLTALNELKQSILQKAFTGELTADAASQTEKAKEEIAA